MAKVEAEADEVTLPVAEPMTATTWEADLSPMSADEDAPFEPEQEDGRDSVSDTKDTGRARLERAGKEHKRTDL